jgi:hypothetical protein
MDELPVINRDIQKELIQKELIQKELIQKELIQKELIQKELIQKELIQKELIQSLGIEGIDRLLFYLAITALELGGYRYGSFLEAASNAAKFAVYVSYLEEDKSLKRTGLIYHIEPKRVKTIVLVKLKTCSIRKHPSGIRPARTRIFNRHSQSLGRAPWLPCQ